MHNNIEFLHYGLKCHIVKIVFLITFSVEVADQIIFGLNLFFFKFNIYLLNIFPA